MIVEVGEKKIMLKFFLKNKNNKQATFLYIIIIITYKLLRLKLKIGERV